MKKIFALVIMSVFLASAVPAGLVYAEDAVYQENAIDKISDWAQTVGKDKTERDRILAQNKAERQKKHTAKMAEKKAKEASKKAEEVKKNMKKKMGM